MKRIDLDCKRSSWSSALIKLQSKSIFILTNKKRGLSIKILNLNNFTICNGDTYQIGGTS